MGRWRKSSPVKVVNATVLNIRSSLATGAQVVGTLKDDRVANADKTLQNGFRQFNTNQWVSNEFLTPGCPPAAERTVREGSRPSWVTHCR